ncbi:MAG: hypothetical protein QW625_02590 [Candidatus Nanoarchaeia archaeon]
MSIENLFDGKGRLLFSGSRGSYILLSELESICDGIIPPFPPFSEKDGKPLIIVQYPQGLTNYLRTFYRSSWEVFRDIISQNRAVLDNAYNALKKNFEKNSKNIEDELKERFGVRPPYGPEHEWPATELEILEKNGALNDIKHSIKERDSYKRVEELSKKYIDKIVLDSFVEGYDNKKILEEEVNLGLVSLCSEYYKIFKSEVEEKILKEAPKIYNLVLFRYGILHSLLDELFKKKKNIELKDKTLYEINKNLLSASAIVMEENPQNLANVGLYLKKINFLDYSLIDNRIRKILMNKAFVERDYNYIIGVFSDPIEREVKKKVLEEIVKNNMTIELNKFANDPRIAQKVLNSLAVFLKEKGVSDNAIKNYPEVLRELQYPKVRFIFNTIGNAENYNINIVERDNLYNKNLIYIGEGELSFSNKNRECVLISFDTRNSNKLSKKYTKENLNEILKQIRGIAEECSKEYEGELFKCTLEEPKILYKGIFAPLNGLLSTKKFIEELLEWKEWKKTKERTGFGFLPIIKEIEIGFSSCILKGDISDLNKWDEAFVIINTLKDRKISIEGDKDPFENKGFLIGSDEYLDRLKEANAKALDYYKNKIYWAIPRALRTLIEKKVTEAEVETKENKKINLEDYFSIKETTALNSIKIEEVHKIFSAHPIYPELYRFFGENFINDEIKKICNETKAIVVPLIATEPTIYYLGKVEKRKGEKLKEEEKYSIYSFLLNDDAKRSFIQRIAYRIFMSLNKIKAEQEKRKEIKNETK